jgi:hypothetical protein
MDPGPIVSEWVVMVASWTNTASGRGWLLVKVGGGGVKVAR